MIKVSDYVMKFLEEKGVEQAFMLPGGGAMHLVDSLGKASIEFTCFAHEQGAAIAAEAYGQHTNTPALLLVTSGPGATNAITGVVAGWIDSTPMFVISGQSKRADLVGDKQVRQIGSQEVQIIDMVKPITKYAVQVMEPDQILYHLERAWCEALSGRPGPVWLSIPLDVQGSMIEEKDLSGYVPIVEMETDITAEVRRTIELLQTSKKPLIIAGNGIKLGNSLPVFEDFIRKFEIPVLTTWKAIDFLGEEDPLYVGHPGIMGDRGANKILQNADLLISIGSRLDTSITAFNDKNFAKNAKKVIIDIDKHEIDRMEMNKDITVVCDAGKFMSCLISEAENKGISVPKWKEWLADCKKLRAGYPTVTDAHRNTGNYVSAYFFIEKLCELLNKDDVIVPESSGGAGEITYQAFKIKKGQKMKNAAGLGSMGFGLPYAIGSCIANGVRRTILINGDGAFQLNIQELETLHRLNLPVKMFIWDNNGYASIRSMQQGNFDGHLVACEESSGFTVPDLQAIAEAYGFNTWNISSNDEMPQQLAEVLNEEGACLCIVKVSPDETVWPRVKAVRMPDGSMSSGPLENMWPYEE